MPNPKTFGLAGAATILGAIGLTVVLNRPTPPIHVPPQAQRVRVAPVPFPAPVPSPTPTPAPVPVRPHPSRPPECDADDITRAERYSATPGYEYLAQKCGIIHAWKADPDAGDVVVWLADHGYDSPAADCDYTVQVDWTKQKDTVRWPLLSLDYHGASYEQPMDVRLDVQEITFRVPCWADRTKGAGVISFAAKTQRCIKVADDGTSGEIPCPVPTMTGGPGQ